MGVFILSKTKKKINWRKVAAWALLIVLIGSMGYSIICYINAPAESGTLPEGTRLKSDYLLMIVQCFAGCIVMFLPSFISKKFGFIVPNLMYIMFYFFLFCGIYLGEVRSFYYLIPQWDMFLHGFSACMLGTLGFSVISMFNDSKDRKINLSPFYVGMFAFCFALSIGALWEIYEFVLDGFFGMNMQKFRLEDGTLLIGREALMDTMEDIMVDCIGALITSVAGALILSHSNKKMKTNSKDSRKQLDYESILIKKAADLPDAEGASKKNTSKE